MSETVVELARAAYERRSKALVDTHLRPWELLPARAREQEVEGYRTVRADALEEAAKLVENGVERFTPAYLSGEIRALKARP